jgi:hypothetical protein
VKIYLATVETQQAGADTYPFSTADRAIEYARAQARELCLEQDDIWERVTREQVMPTGRGAMLYHARFGGDSDQAYVIERELDAIPDDAL